jgi:hypothetical protein
MLDFPNAPTVGQKYPQPPVSGAPVYTWDGVKWTTVGGPVSGASYGLGSLFNVQAYGATGNGVTNDTAAIQAAINAAGPTNAAVYFPAGVYIAVGLVITPITNPSTGLATHNPSLIGDGSRSSIIKRPPNVNGHLLTISFIDQSATAARAAQTRITGLGFDGTPGTATTGHSIYCPDGPGGSLYGYAPWLEDVFLDGSPQYGLYCGNQRNFGYFQRVNGLYSNSNLLNFQNNGDHSFVQCAIGCPLTNTQDVVVFNNVFSAKFFGCDFFHNGTASQASAFNIQGTYGYMGFHECVFNGCGQQGVKISGGANSGDYPVQFFGCMFQDNSQQASGSYSHVLASSRANVAFLGCKFLTPNSGVATPKYLVEITGTAGPVIFSGCTVMAGSYAVAISNNTLAAPSNGVASTGLQINGGFEINQEKTGVATSTNNGYIVDGWVLGLTLGGGGTVSASQQSSPMVPGFPNWLGLGVGTAQPTLGATDWLLVSQRIEGNRVARLSWGTANARPLTIGFWTCHTVAGTYSVAVRNPSANLSYVASYTQNVASALEYKTITIPGATTGTWSSDNTLWGSVDFCLATGANYVAPSANSWNSGNFLCVPGQTNLLATSGNGFRLTGVIFLAGNEAPSAAMSPFCMPTPDQALALCRRYYQKSYEPGSNPGAASAPNIRLFLQDGLSVASHDCYRSIELTPAMRANPTVTMFSGSSGAAGKVFDGMAGGDVAASISYLGQTAFTFHATTAPNAYMNIQAHWVADARL